MFENAKARELEDPKFKNHWIIISVYHCKE
jgi:hypothetical protein